ncbi:enoyl-CoA hydratase-related protein [Chloroflexota bacterium]
MPISGPEVLLYEKKDGIVVITLNRPERLNALSLELRERLDEAWTRFAEDDDAKIAILTGTGDRAFCVGLDLKDQAERAEETGSGKAKFRTEGLDIYKPTIAAVNGLAMGGGWKMAQDCDIRIVAEHAEFAASEVKWGRGDPWAIPLLWMIPFGIILELLMTGEKISAQRAYEIGFVNKVVPKEQLLTETIKMAGIICENAPLSVRAVKEMFYKARDMDYTAGMNMAAHLWEEVYKSEDAIEGPKAFTEKRKPVWKGR